MSKSLNKDEENQISISDQIDMLCDEFERELIGGRKPGIETYLEKCPQQKDKLLQELLTLEIDARRGWGDTPTVLDYTTRFPQFPSSIEAAFAAAKTVRQWTVGRSTQDDDTVTFDAARCSPSGHESAPAHCRARSIPVVGSDWLRRIRDGLSGDRP